MTEPNDVVSAVAASFQSIPIDHIRPAAHQARKSFADESIKKLALSMKEEGLIQPITVRVVPPATDSLLMGASPRSSWGGRRPDEGPFYELVSGERRLRAAKLLGWTAIDARIIQTVSEGEAAAKGLIENLQREDLNPIEEAEGLANLGKLDPSYWTQEKIALITGKSQSYISETLRLLDFSDKVKENIRRLIITSGHASALLRLPTPELQDKVAAKIEKKGLTVMQTRDVVAKLLAKEEAKADPAGQKALPASASFKFSRKGTGFTVAAFSPDADNFDKFLDDLRGAYTAWVAKKASGKAVRDKGVAQAGNPTTSSRRLPQTLEEQAELEAIAVAATGPGPVYAWIFGQESKLTKMVASMSWKDMGAQDSKEGLQKILAAMQTAKEQGL
jgi:ParB family chromosome partitioning protein